MVTCCPLFFIVGIMRYEASSKAKPAVLEDWDNSVIVSSNNISNLFLSVSSSKTHANYDILLLPVHCPSTLCPGAKCILACVVCC